MDESGHSDLRLAVIPHQKLPRHVQILLETAWWGHEELHAATLPAT